LALTEEPNCYEQVDGMAAGLAKLCETTIVFSTLRYCTMRLLSGRWSWRRLENQPVFATFASVRNQNHVHPINIPCESRP
jgi:hypothetical protein